MTTSSYPFGERAAALIGVSLDSRGNIAVLGRSRADLSLPMKARFSATPAQAPQGDLEFTFSVAPSYVGLLSIEAAGWTRPYDLTRVHFLGHAEPFGSDELEYDPQRSHAVPANRKFTCTYSTATGKLQLKDGVGSSVETLDLRSLDDAEVNYTGRLLVVVRVINAQFVDQCVKLSFGGGVKFNGHTAGGTAINQQGEFHLNRNTENP
jgi:hypothetical protein